MDKSIIQLPTCLNWEKKNFKKVAYLLKNLCNCDPTTIFMPLGEYPVCCRGCGFEEGDMEHSGLPVFLPPFLN